MSTKLYNDMDEKERKAVVTEFLVTIDRNMLAKVVLALDIVEQYHGKLAAQNCFEMFLAQKGFGKFCVGKGLA